MKMAYLLGAAVVAAAAYGYADRARRPVAAVQETVGESGAVAQAAAPGAEGTISGQVLETIDVSKYTYLRLATGQGEVWAAVSKAAIARGASVSVEHAARMDHFESTTLKRTFDVIYFGSLAGADGMGGALPAGHPSIGSNAELPMNGHVDLGNDPGVPGALLDNPGGALPPGHPVIGQGSMATAMNGEQAMPADHPATAPTSQPMTVPKLARAEGPNGYVIADLFANKQRLSGKRVRVRGMVTKVTLDVLGGTFLHLRDGSGDGVAKTDDLAVTTPARPARGDVLVLEGVLRPDADLGIGYRYPALLEKATVVKD